MLTLGSAFGADQFPLVLDPNNLKVINLAPTTEVFIDQSATKHVDKIVDLSSEFEPIGTEYIDFGLGQFRVWLKTSIYNASPENYTWRLDLGRQFTQDLDVYLKSGGHPPEHILHHELSDSFDKRPIDNRMLAVDIKLPPNEPVQIYVGYRSLSTTSLPMVIGPPDQIVERRAAEAGIDAILNGALLCMIIIALILTPSLGFRLSASFCGYILAGILYVAHADGYTFKYLWPNWPSGNDALNLSFMLLMSATAFNFARALFDFKNRWPLYDRLLIAYIFAALMFAILAVPFVHVNWLMIISYSLVPIGALVQPITGILAYRRKMLGATPFTIGSVLVLLALVYASVAHLYPGRFNLDRTLDVGHLALLGDAFAFAVAITLRQMGVQRERDAAITAEIQAVRARLAVSDTLRETEKQYVEARKTTSLYKDQLSSIGHDLRQPLTNMRNVIVGGTFGDEEKGKQLLAALDYLETLAGNQLDDRDIKIGDHQSDGALECFSVSIILTNAFEMFKSEADEKGIDLRLHLRGDLVVADAVSIMRVTCNLLKNAIQNTSTGKILLGARRKGQRVQINVYDTGGGMNADDIQYLMQRHSRGEGSKGSGLGLDIVREISDRYELDFTLSSKLGCGTHARFFVPRSV